MAASGSMSLAIWMSGLVVGLVVMTTGAWFASRLFDAGDATAPAAVQAPGPEGRDGNLSNRSTADPEPSGKARGARDDRAVTEAAGDTGDADPASDPLPRLHEVRLEPDGLAVIAGKVQPFADIVLRLDGAEIARASADGSGAFATVAMVEPSKAARVLTLAQVDAAGQEIASPDELILAPVRTSQPEPKTAVAARGRGDEGSGEAWPLETAAPARVAASDDALPRPIATADPRGATRDGNREVAREDPAAEAPVSDRPRGSEPSAPTVDGEAAQTGSGAGTEPAADADNDSRGDTQQVAILRMNEDGVSVLRPADGPVEAMSRVALDSISYSERGDVQLQGRAQQRAEEVRIYLDNRPVAVLDVDASGSWRGALPQVDDGVYTLRIDEVDAQGRVTSRVETPFKREAPEVLAAASANTTGRVAAVTVQRGDTLWAISRERYGDGILYVRVFEANRDSIRDPDLIYPGQVFSLPSE